jgi:hypothetical protein
MSAARLEDARDRDNSLRRVGAVLSPAQADRRALLGEVDRLQQRVAELEAEFTGETEWTIGGIDHNGQPFYTETRYTEAGARHHAARRQGEWFPAWRYATTFHRVNNSAEEAEFRALRVEATKETK